MQPLTAYLRGCCNHLNIHSMAVARPAIHSFSTSLCLLRVPASQAVNKLMHKDKKRSKAALSNAPTARASRSSRGQLAAAAAAAASQAGADEAEGTH